VPAVDLEMTAVLGDAEFGDTTTPGLALYRLHLPYALGVSSTLTVFRGTPRASRPAAEGFRLDRCRRAARKLCQLSN
jgi:SRSO17 transposase